MMHIDYKLPGKKKKVFKLSKGKIENISGVPYGQATEKNPMGGRGLSDWC